MKQTDKEKKKVLVMGLCIGVLLCSLSVALFFPNIKEDG